MYFSSQQYFTLATLEMNRPEYDVQRPCAVDTQRQRQQRAALGAAPQSHHPAPQLLQVSVDVIGHHPGPVLMVQAVGQDAHQHLCSVFFFFKVNADTYTATCIHALSHQQLL